MKNILKFVINVSDIFYYLQKIFYQLRKLKINFQIFNNDAKAS